MGASEAGVSLQSVESGRRGGACPGLVPARVEIVRRPWFANTNDYAPDGRAKKGRAWNALHSFGVA